VLTKALLRPGEAFEVFLLPLVSKLVQFLVPSEQQRVCSFPLFQERSVPHQCCIFSVRRYHRDIRGYHFS
jgi:hypothetical protein